MAPLDCNLDHLTENTFTAGRTRQVADAACRLVSLESRGMELLRHQTNAVYKLASAPVIVKVARPNVSHSDAVVSLVRWLSTHGVPTVTLIPGLDQPLTLAGCAVTFWQYLPQAGPIRACDIAEPLAMLHQVPPPAMSLPRLAPVHAIQRAISTSALLVESEKTILQRRCDDLAESFADLRYMWQPTLIHGDPQHRNALWNEETGQPVLCDWESAAIGQAEWDLVTVEIHCRRFGHLPREYHAFCQRYGFDIREWDGYDILRDLRELRMITTNARKSHPGSPEASEVRRRVAELDRGPSRRWVIL
ncbi:phosphotransferase family protein [Actinokineospora sp. 24-640]